MFYTKIKRSLAVASLVLLGTPAVVVAPVAVAQVQIPTQRVQFAPGATSATIEDTIRGYEIIDYLVSARAGQSINVSMATNNSANYFNILAPGENEVAMFNGSVNENQFEGTLPATGDYKIRVYQMRSAARRNEVANYRLEIVIAPLDPPSEQTDALVPSTNYNATGDIPCSMGNGQPTGYCPFGVTRQGSGNGSVTVTKPNGRTRVIFFENGRAVGYDESQADPGSFSTERQSDLNIIRIGQERYEIPDAVIWGG